MNFLEKYRSSIGRSIALYICDPILENHTFGYIQNLWECSIENFFHILIKQLLSLLAVKFHTHSFFILGDILNYIRPCSSFTMRGTAINLQIG